MANLKNMSEVEQNEYLMRKLGYVIFERPKQYWLKTGSKRLNRVLGSENLGIPYGKQITLAGKQSSGKTLIALRLAGLAQKDGARVAWVDIENSFDPAWALKQGLDAGDPVLDNEGRIMGYSKIQLIQTQFGYFKQKEKKAPKFGPKVPKEKKETDPDKIRAKQKADVRQQSAEEVLTIMEKWMLLQHEINPNCKVFVGLDSTTALQPGEEIEAGYTDQNMRTKMSLAPLLNQMTKRMIPISLNVNALMVYICQLRTNPTAAMFGNPDYISGGNGILFYPSAIVWMKRIRNMFEDGKNVGLESIINNKKNKMGGGSVELDAIGVKMKFQSDIWRFTEAAELMKKRNE